ncbi:Protein giant-lens [Folsomia candida]|uniref:Protein giant-lens n=1 Tax=Folsomia candida TaxID=158441 RepID=A0A226F6Q3_FOLCA|nr:Protein giant-lens [Folsomia candida]
MPPSAQLPPIQMMVTLLAIRLDFIRSLIFQICEPVRKLPKCRYFRDITWVLTTKNDTLVNQVVNCICPKDSVAYMIKRQAFTESDDSVGFRYSFACSPPTRVLCQRKEPCRLFSVKRRSSFTEVNTSVLCHCPRGFECPSHHTDSTVIPGKFYDLLTRTFSGYCV